MVTGPGAKELVVPPIPELFEPDIDVPPVFRPQIRIRETGMFTDLDAQEVILHILSPGKSPRHVNQDPADTAADPMITAWLSVYPRDSSSATRGDSSGPCATGVAARSVLSGLGAAVLTVSLAVGQDRSANY